jgi:hypothetical protein
VRRGTRHGNSAAKHAPHTVFGLYVSAPADARTTDRVSGLTNRSLRHLA